MFSIIIPVYNVEDYLEQCIESVLLQSYQNWEMVLVDDGSKDYSSKICDNYSDMDSRINVIHKENGGLSSARNTGLRLAKGEYILFLDSDDYWNDSDALMNIAKLTHQKPDFICFGYREYQDGIGDNGKGITIQDELPTNMGFDETMYHLLSNGFYVSSACCKATRREVIHNSKLFFVEGITSEDIDWSARLLKKVNSVAVYPNSFYIYRQRTDSIVHTIKYENLKMLSDNIIRCIEAEDDCVLPKERDLLYYNYVSYQYITFLKVSLLCESDPRTKPLVKQMKSYRWLLKYHLNKKVKIVYWINRIFGFSTMMHLLKLYSRRSK